MHGVSVQQWNLTLPMCNTVKHSYIVQVMWRSVWSSTAYTIHRHKHLESDDADGLPHTGVFLACNERFHSPNLRSRLGGAPLQHKCIVRVTLLFMI